MSTLVALQDLIKEKYGLDAEALDPNTPMSDKGLDSLALVEFLFAVEDHFGITLPDADANVTTLAQLAELVDATLAKKS
jgi:acyl carrier protein